MKKSKIIEQIPPGVEAPRALWNKRQVARFLGVAVSTVDMWVSGKRLRKGTVVGLRFLKIGTLVRFRPEDVFAYCEEQKRQPATRIEAKA